MPELLRAEGLGMRFAEPRRLRRRSSVTWAVRGVDLTLGQEEILGIVGESGAGKSTVGKMLVGLLTPTEGRIILSGSDITCLPAGREARRGMQMVFQDPTSSVDPRARVFDIVAEGLIARGKGDRTDRVVEALQLVNLQSEIGARLPSQCSGGELQRVGIARALVVDPKVVVADEPFSAVDVSTQATLVRLLLDIRSRLGTAFVIISHDLHVMRRLCDRVIVMYAGAVCEAGTTSAVMARPRHPYTAALVAATTLADVEPRRPDEAAVAEEDPAGSSGVGCPYAARCPRGTAVCHASVPALAGAAGESRQVACWNPLPDPVTVLR